MGPEVCKSKKEIKQLTRARLSGIVTYLKKDCVSVKGTRSFLESWELETAEAHGVSTPDLTSFSIRGMWRWILQDTLAQTS